MTQTWYRGIAPGRKPSPAGKDVHDFGDGLYFADQLETASQYAWLRQHDSSGARSLDKGIVFQVEVSTSQIGKVLDLRSSPAWSSFLSKKIHGTSPNDVLTSPSGNSVRNELYNHYFTLFLKQQGLKVEDFDAVIGPDFVRGGNQLCLLFRKGTNELTRRHQKILNNLRPAFFNAKILENIKRVIQQKNVNQSGLNLPSRAVRYDLKKVSVKYNLFRFAASVVGGIVVDIVFSALYSLIWNKLVLEPAVQKQMKKYADKIESEIHQYILLIAYSQRQGTSMHVNFSYTIRWQDISGSILPQFLKHNIVISTKKGTIEEIDLSTIDKGAYMRAVFNVRYTEVQYKTTYPADLEYEYLELYNTVSNQIEYCNTELSKSSYYANALPRDLLLAERDRLVDTISKHFEISKIKVIEHFQYYTSWYN